MTFLRKGIAHILPSGMKRHGTLDGHTPVKRARSDSSTDASPEISQPLYASTTQIGMSGGTAINSTVAGVMNSETNLKIQSTRARKHVSTHIEDVAYRHLTEKGCVVIKGRSGSGKSHLGYTLLGRVSKAFSRLPLKVSSPEEWNYVPKSLPRDSEMHNVLVEKGADAKIKNTTGKTALHYTAAIQCERSAKILLPVSDVDAQDQYGDTALHCIHQKCPGSRRAEMYKLFMEKGANVDIKNEMGQTPLHKAVVRQTVDSVRLLLSAADINAQDNNGKTALHLVRHMPSHQEDNCHELYKLFVEKMADGNLKENNFGETALHQAAEARCPECVRLLIEVTDVNVQDSHGNTAAHVIHESSFFTTVEDNCHEILRLLIQKGLDGHIRNEKGQTALHLIASKQCFQGVKLLLDVSDVNAQDNAGNTAFHHLHSAQFCKDGCEKVYQDHIAKCGDVKLRNRNGLTALHNAAKSKCTKCIELMRNELDVNAQDEDGNTALHYIHESDCRKPCRDIILQLFEMGADGHAKNVRGQTPLHLAAREQCREGVSVLLPVSEVNAQDRDGNTPLHSVYYIGFGKELDRYRELYELLTENGADIHIENQSRETAEQLTKKRRMFHGEITLDQPKLVPQEEASSSLAVSWGKVGTEAAKTASVFLQRAVQKQWTHPLDLF
ncbi:putative ankyrin repeat protein RF_0381 [Haliotis asinina]|uniref:putative ankyrin repeat protein RF_0381 n=1 Tax=Haliotis asinina TaxID=109174 RepID=UPI003531B58F